MIDYKYIHGRYMNGESLLELCKEYNIAFGTIYREFHKNNLSLKNNRDKSLKNSCNESYFEEIDTSDKAYWLGFIYADGYVTKKSKHSNRVFGVSLGIKDIDHLYKLKKCLDSTHEIKIYKTVSGYKEDLEYARFKISSPKLTDDLIKHGVLEDKTNILKPPNIKDVFVKDFIRGYLDGDGSIWKQTSKGCTVPQYSISFCGTDDILTYIMDYLIENKLIKRKYKLNKRKPNQIVSNFKFGGNHQALRFLSFLYENSKMYLDRKYDIYLQLKQLLNSRL